MKTFIILLSLLLLSGITIAQDLIITKAGDTIKCQITKTDQKNIYFRYLKNGGVERSLIPVSSVENYQYVYPGSDWPKSGFPPLTKHSQFRIGAGGGYSYRLEKVPDNAGDFKGYLEKLKSGFNIEAEADYFIKKSYGIGLRYNFFRAKNYMDNVTFVISNGHSFDTLVGNIGDDIRIHYIGPVFYYRFFNRNERIVWLIGASLGYARYINNGILLSEDVKFSASTAGISAIFGADIFLMNNMAIGLSLSVDLGTLTSITRTYQGTTTTKKLAVHERIDISLINLTAGVRFWK
jgi:hypothetical protein